MTPRSADRRPRPRVRPLPPAPATRLIGRGRERDEVIDLVCADDTRLVTLVGPGGVGKTRLALEAAPLVAQLLKRCATVTVLATSREALDLAAEHVYPVAPLALPAGGERLTAAGVEASPAGGALHFRRQAARSPAARRRRQRAGDRRDLHTARRPPAGARTRRRARPTAGAGVTRRPPGPRARDAGERPTRRWRTPRRSPTQTSTRSKRSRESTCSTSSTSSVPPGFSARRPRSGRSPIPNSLSSSSSSSSTPRASVSATRAGATPCKRAACSGSWK